MNLSHSAPMLAVDPALPQRDLLLDETVMSEYLSRLVARCGDFVMQDCERLRTKYRVGTSLRVLYEVSGNGRSYRIAARAFPRTRRVKDQFESAFEIHAAELNTKFWIFPHDRKIRNLPVLSDIPGELRDLEGHAWIKSRIVGHAPEKSVTAQCLSADENILAYAKIYAGDEGRQVFGTYSHVTDELKTDAGDLQIPRAIAYSEKHHLLLLDSVSGVLLSAVTRARREKSFFRLGQALKTLHRMTPPASIPKSTRLRPEALTQTATIISQARPDVASLVQRLTTRLIAGYEQVDEDKPVFLHGDVHPKNILLDNEHLYLLDLDQAATGIAAVDLGSVIAGLYCDSCIGSLSTNELSSLKRAFLMGYGPLKSAQTLRWHVAAALLQERALRSVSRVRTTSLQKLPELLLTAEAVLNGGIGEN